MGFRLPEWDGRKGLRWFDREVDALPPLFSLVHWDALVDENFVDRLHHDFIVQVARFRDVLLGERMSWIRNAASGRAGDLARLLFVTPSCELLQTITAKLAPQRSPEWCGHQCVQVVDNATRQSLAVMALEWVERFSWQQQTAACRPDSASDRSGVDDCELARIDSILGVRHFRTLQQARVLGAPIPHEPPFVEVVELISRCTRSRLRSWSVSEDGFSELVIHSAWRHLPSLTQILGVQSFDN